MSEFHDIAADIVSDRASFTTDPVTNLRTGIVFTAEIDSTPDSLVVETELGEDYRNVVLLHVTSHSEAAGIKAQDRVTFALFGRIVTAKILKRRNNPATAQSDFWAMELATGTDR